MDNGVKERKLVEHEVAIARRRLPDLTLRNKAHLLQAYEVRAWINLESPDTYADEASL